MYNSGYESKRSFYTLTQNFIEICSVDSEVKHETSCKGHGKMKCPCPERDSNPRSQCSCAPWTMVATGIKTSMRN